MINTDLKNNYWQVTGFNKLLKDTVLRIQNYFRDISCPEVYNFKHELILVKISKAFKIASMWFQAYQRLQTRPITSPSPWLIPTGTIMQKLRIPLGRKIEILKSVRSTSSGTGILITEFLDAPMKTTEVRKGKVKTPSNLWWRKLKKGSTFIISEITLYFTKIRLKIQESRRLGFDSPSQQMYAK